MNLLRFLTENWDSALVVVALAGLALTLIYGRQYAVLNKIVFALVVEAEKKFGGGTGAAKLAAVVDWLYPRIPAVVRLFITEKHRLRT